MNLTRKEFFRQGLFSLGKTALDIAGTLQGAQACSIAELPEDGPLPDPDPDKVACSDNQYCLGKNCGCLACVERCETQAILLVPGLGIRINESVCTGCGTCAYVCPVSPKAVRMQPRPKKDLAAETETM